MESTTIPCVRCRKSIYILVFGLFCLEFLYIGFTLSRCDCKQTQTCTRGNDGDYIDTNRTQVRNDTNRNHFYTNIRNSPTNRLSDTNIRHSGINKTTKPYIRLSDRIGGSVAKVEQSGSVSITNTRNTSASSIHAPDYHSRNNCTSAGLSYLRKRKLMICDYLYRDVEWDEFYSKNYYAVLQKITEILYNKYANIRLEGNIGRTEKKSQAMCYYDLARRSGVKSICEIGFNAGHSTLLWLAASSHTKVYSWDLGEHPYTKRIAEYLKYKFPGRLNIFYGNSTKTVPLVARQMVNGRRSLECDIISIDGGHTYGVAKTDIINMKQFATPSTIVIVDDVSEDVDYAEWVLNAWRDVIQMGQAEQEFMCTYRTEPRGYLIGKYL